MTILSDVQIRASVNIKNMPKPKTYKTILRELISSEQAKIK